MEKEQLIKTATLLAQERAVRQSRVNEYVNKANVELQCIGHIDSQLGDIQARISQLASDEVENAPAKKKAKPASA